MKKWILFGLLVLAASAVAADVDAEKPAGPLEASECDPEACKLPSCRCSTTEIPGGLAARDIPQFVTVTFDAVNDINIVNYRRILLNRRNSNNCSAGATFYVTHVNTDYQAVNELYNNGFEIALHSITHRPSQSYWANATYETLVKEFAEQKSQLAHFANIPYESIKGLRLPYFQMAGDANFKMMANHNIMYDCSWETTTETDPGLWPYTLDYKSTQECIVPPCPTSSIPGPWVYPLVAWSDLQNLTCSFVDVCLNTPDRNDENAWYDFILTNFERHYKGSRAPFGFFVREAFLAANPAVTNALIRFLDLVNSLNDAYMVTSEEVIEWVKNPVTVSEYRQQTCRRYTPTVCRPTSCGPLTAEASGNVYWMQICNVCPRVYPWINNPLGQ
ncbi:chitin deacetylase 8-like [Anticarsia gemmatalis]|uniref:chitin deacetylase 8-like n=1 Tax=Anticarsia gemmatalis TaxID=129554 RepID=UPI003F76C023